MEGNALSPERLVLPALLALLAAVAGAPSARARGFPVASLGYEYVPEAELVLTGLEEDEVRTAARTATLKLNVPILLEGRDKVLLNALTIRHLDQSYAAAESGRDTFRPDDLYTFKWGLVYRQVLGQHWSGAVLVQPAVLSDLEDLDGNDFSLRAGFVFERKVSERFTWGWGAGYSDDYGRKTVLPVLRLQWTTGRWEANVDAPQSAAVWRELARGWRIGAEAKVTGGAFRVGQDYALDGSTTKDGTVRYSIVNVGPAVVVPLGGPVELEMNGGTSVYRRYEVLDADGASLVDSAFESSAFVAATVSVRVE